jgi:predicted RNA-binding protein with PIN domain
MNRTGPVHVLIDGHNLIYQHPQLRHLMAQPEAGRTALEALLAHRPRLTIFYDGGPGGMATATRRSGLAIDYSGTGQADDRVVRWLMFHPHVRASVVSDDRELQRRIRAFGAQTVAVAEFIALLERGRPPERQPDGRPDGPLSPAQVEAWMRLFGIGDETAG